LFPHSAETKIYAKITPLANHKTLLGVIQKEGQLFNKGKGFFCHRGTERTEGETDFNRGEGKFPFH
jgi:hypothetical protein